MPFPVSAIFALLLQVGPAPTLQPASPIPDELIEQRQLRRQSEQDRTQEQSAPDRKLARCLARIEADPEGAKQAASSWLDHAPLVQRPPAAQCLGEALVQLGLWKEAESAFLQGRDSTLPKAQLTRAQLGAMAGNAALGAQDPATAATILERAQSDANAAANDALIGEIALDRARALVALGHNDDAAKALTAARTELPANPQAWLLSATLARRMGDLTSAQTHIEQAAHLSPGDPEIGLEAGVIAVLSGRDDAARKSWESVVTLAPYTPFAKTAKAYLAQLDTQAVSK